MKCRVPSLLAGLFAASLPACSLLHRDRSQAAAASAPLQASPGMVGKRPNARGLAVEIKSGPDPIKLGETREINVTLILRNTSKVAANNLKFETSQLIEILLRDPDTGKVVSQWSTDHSFTPDSRYLVIDPQERLEYNQPITTRELKAGKAYNLEGYFVGYDQELRAMKVIVPQP